MRGCKQMLWLPPPPTLEMIWAVPIFVQLEFYIVLGGAALKKHIMGWPSLLGGTWVHVHETSLCITVEPVNSLVKGTEIFEKSSSHLRILNARRMTCWKCHTEDPWTLGVTVQSLIAMATWCLGFPRICASLSLVYVFLTLPHGPCYCVFMTCILSWINRNSERLQSEKSGSFMLCQVLNITKFIFLILLILYWHYFYNQTFSNGLYSKSASVEMIHKVFLSLLSRSKHVEMACSLEMWWDVNNS
jgi:hypothetical protein